MRPIVRLRVAPLALALVTASSRLSAAEPEDPPISTDHREELVVTAARVEVPLLQAGTSITVIDREEIERRRETSVAELLRSVAGLEVVATGGPGGATSVFVRGANSAHTLVLVDGVRVNDALTGAFDWADLTTDEIERIEVARGPQSALYGSEAIGGVIRVVTRRGASDVPVAGGGEAGTQDSYRLWTRAGGGGEVWHWNAGASLQETDGVSRASEEAGNRENDPWRNVTVAGALDRSLGRDGSAQLALRYVDARTGLDAFDFTLGPIDDPNYVQDRESALASFELQLPLGAGVSQRVRAGLADETLATHDPDPDPAFHQARLDSTSLMLETQTDLTLAPTSALSVGLAFEDRDGSSAGNVSESVHLGSAFAEHRFRWHDRFFLTVGARYDDHSTFGGETTWRLAGSWLLAASRLRLHASVGTGFRAPSLVDLYYPFYGNTELDPERSTSLDLGIEQSWLGDRLRLDVTGFSSEIDDLIVFDASTFLAGNVARAEIDGLEGFLGWRPSATLRLEGSYTLTDSEDRATGLPLSRRPRHRGVFSIALAPAGRFRGVLSWLAVRERVEFDGQPLDDYERLDLTLDYRLGPRWSGYVRARNLLDAEYEEVSGFTAPGLQAVAGLRYGG